MITKLVTIILSLLLFSIGIAQESTDIKKNKPTEITRMNTYLEQQSKDSEPNKFWELQLEGKRISIRTGAIDTSGVTKKHDYVSETVAQFEAYKLIIQKNKEGFYTPNRINLETLLTYKITDIKDIDKSLYSSLQGNHYKKFIHINGDLSLDKLDIDGYQGKIDGLIVNGNLTVDGGIYNTEGDYGPALIVTGDVRANYVFGGGSEIYFEGNSYIHGFIVGHYNHGTLHLNNTTAMVEIDDDHDMSTGFNSNVIYSYEVHHDRGDVTKLKQAFGKNVDFIKRYDDEVEEIYEEENTYFDTYAFMASILDNDEESLRLLHKILDPNHAHKPQLVEVIKDGLLIKQIKNPNQELQLAAVKQNGLALEFIKDASEAVKIAAVTENPHALEFIKDPSVEVQLATVESAVWGIELINNPSDKVIRHAVATEGIAIEYIEKPSEELQLLAVTSSSGYYSNAIEYIQNPSEQVQLAAVNQRGDALKYIKNASDAVKLAAIKNDGSALRFIKNPSYEMQLIAIENAGWVIEVIENPTEELMLLAVKDEAAAIDGIKNPSEAAQLIVVKDNPFNIDRIKAPTVKVQITAVSDIAKTIEDIKNPSEAVQLAAIRNEPEVIKFIENPTEKAIALAKALSSE